MPVPAPGARGGRAGEVAEFGEGGRLAGRAQGHPRRLRRQAACGWSRTRNRPAAVIEQAAERGVAPVAEDRGAVRPRARRAGRALPARPGRRVPGGRDGAARRHLPRGVRAGARRRRAGRARGPADRADASPRSSTSPACWRSSCSRPRTAGCWSTSSRCARTTPGTGRIDGAVTSQFEKHLRAVLDLPLGSPAAARAAGRDGERARRRPRRTSTRRTCTAWPATRACKIHLYGKAVTAGRKVGHVTVLGDELEDCVERARHAADYLQRRDR